MHAPHEGKNSALVYKRTFPARDLDTHKQKKLMGTEEFDLEESKQISKAVQKMGFQQR